MFALKMDETIPLCCVELLYTRKPTPQARLGSRAGIVGALGRLGTWPPFTVMCSKYLPNIHLEEEAECCVGEGVWKD